MITLKTISNNIINEIVIKNSRFICLIYKLSDSSIDKYINLAKEKYPKATHYCYGYRFGDMKGSFDDGEPGGTAGLPILGVLEKEDLQNILVIVVRYFGGIKLGAGGLIRAYTKAVCEALNNTSKVLLVEGFKVVINFSYSEQKRIDYILNSSVILEKKYDEDISYIVLIEKDIISKLDGYNYEIIDKVLIEKKA